MNATTRVGGTRDFNYDIINFYQADIRVTTDTYNKIRQFS